MDNATLIFDLNEVRKKNSVISADLNYKLSQIEAQKNEILRLNKELGRLKKIDGHNKQKSRISSVGPRTNMDRMRML